jgi:hypothetical protein
VQAGVEWNPGAGEVGFIGNWIANVESPTFPMISFGTSSDRIGTPKGPHAYYVTFAKSIPELKLAPYISVNYSEFDRQISFPFGASWQVGPGISTMFMHDGRKSHLLLTYSKETWSVSAMWIWFRHPGISVSFGF